LKLNLDTGHMGTYFAKYGGKFGEAAVKFLDAVFKDDATAKAAFCGPNAELVKKNWKIEERNWCK
jgi:hypothetical protein